MRTARVVGLAASGTARDTSYNKIINFPAASNANYISFNPELPALTGLTVCAWKQDKDNGRARYWFSYAVPGNDNELILGDANVSYTKIIKVKWIHVCGAWDSETGNAVISINGKAVNTVVVKKGEALRAGGNLVIGQEQDTVGGGFDSNQAYIGNLYNINMWDRALTQAEIASMFNEGMCGIFFAGLSGSEPIISYADILAKEMHGDVSVVDGECDVVECPPVVECPVVECPVVECPALFCPEKECPVTECPAVTCPEKECPAVKECPVVEEIECPAKEECSLPARDCPGIEPHQPACWKPLEETRFKGGVSIGYIEGDINAAKAVCYASGTCLAISCAEKKGAVSCQLLTSFGKEKKGKGMTSFVYTC
ncbi:uncharacterized protein LOC134820217 [Bolinopsis microptera]|uniref:uncharacterized protein LOC134820217 n=1 Tax=Bolinopsis microptera TaxID=2820187 RepID=UPI00307A8C13